MIIDARATLLNPENRVYGSPNEPPGTDTIGEFIVNRAEIAQMHNSRTGQLARERGIDLSIAMQTEAPVQPPSDDKAYEVNDSELLKNTEYDASDFAPPMMEQDGYMFNRASQEIHDWHFKVGRYEEDKPGKYFGPDSDWLAKSPEEVSQFGLEYGGGLAYSDIGMLGAYLMKDDLPPDVAMAQLILLDKYDKLPNLTWSGTYRMFKHMVTNPTTYFTAGSLSAVRNLSYQGGKKALHNSLRKHLWTQLTDGLKKTGVASVKYGTIPTETALIAGFATYAQQHQRWDEDEQGPFQADWDQIMFATGGGATLGVAGQAVVPVVKAVSSAMSKTAKDLAEGRTLTMGVGPTDGAATGADVSEIGFYSAVTRAVDALPQDKGTAVQMRQMIAKTEGVKPEEMAWIGLDDFLKGRKNVTKQEIKDFVAANQVRVEQVTKSAGGGSGRGTSEISDELERVDVIPNGAEHELRIEQGIISEHRLRSHDVHGDMFGEIDDVQILESLDYTKRSTVGNIIRQVQLHVDNDQSFFVDDLTKLRPEVQKVINRYKEFPKATEPEVREMLGDEVFEELAEGLGEFQVYRGDGMLLGTRPDLGAAEHIARRHLSNEAGGGRGDTMFGEHTLPGGKNYREVLLTMGPRLEDYPTREAYNEAIRAQDARGGPFQQGHFDEANVLAHIRLNDRTGPNGEKILFVEEIQSDWHQKGRKKGYKEPLKPLSFSDASIEERPLTWAAVFPDGTEKDVGKGTVSGREGAEEYFKRWFKSLNKEAVSERLGRVPDAPLKTSWHEMSLRRVLRMAAEEGYDSVAWTPGKVQADRYNLSKQIDELFVAYGEPGTVNISGSKGGEDVLLNTAVPIEKIDEVVGKDIADKIRKHLNDNPPSSEVAAAEKRIKEISDATGGDVTGNGTPEQIKEWSNLNMSIGGNAPKPLTLSGVDLQVGGEGMEGFYDKMLKNYAAKFGKKFGAKVGVTEIDTGIRSDLSGIHIIEHNGKWTVRDRVNGGSLADFNNKADAESYVAGLEIQTQRESTPEVWTIPITKRMRDSLMQEGAPLFSAAPIAAAGLAGEDRAE